jgi:hypothetical protein
MRICRMSKGQHMDVDPIRNKETVVIIVSGFVLYFPDISYVKE